MKAGVVDNCNWTWRKTLDRGLEKLLSQNDSFGHPIDHARRVWKLAYYIYRCEKKTARLEALYAGAMMHDIGHTIHNSDDPMHEKHAERGAEKVKPILKKIGFPEEQIILVEEIVRLHDKNKPWANHEKSEHIEVWYVQDADDIEALGAMGVSRMTDYGARVGRPTYNPNVVWKDKDPKTQSTIQNIILHAEIYKSLNTATAKRIALPRVQYMLNFVETFKQEYELSRL